MSTKEKIILAAINVFSSKGKHGTRMEEVAEEAKINKAMLYYYFSTKDNLYHEALSHILVAFHQKLHENIEKLCKQTNDHIERIRYIIKGHMKTFMGNLNHTKIMLEALANEPEHYMEIMRSIKAKEHYCGERYKNGGEFAEMFSKGVKDGVFRNVDPGNLLVSILGMDMIYFAAKPVTQALSNVDIKDEEKFLNKRTESIIDLVLYGMVKRGI